MQSFTFLQSLWILVGDKLIYMSDHCLCALGFVFWGRWEGASLLVSRLLNLLISKIPLELMYGF